MFTVEPNRRPIAGHTSPSQWLLPAFWIIVGSGFYYGATKITTAIVQDKHDPGPAAICTLCATALILLGITQAALLLRARFTAITPDTTRQSNDTQQTNTSPITPRALRQAFLGVAAIVVYIFSVFQVGFGVATLVFGIISMKSLGASWVSTLLATVACIATVYLVFIELLGILLPTGRWDLPF
ncbi:MAG: tripartite tricarboxylate transporter TctB family protein [Planctomycetaceae bacterium]|nr:tripartite tricarboxylate transporter TctB family protein [Planctomycetaceae bacterium]